MSATAYQREVATLDFDERMKRRAARRSTPEFKARVEAIQRRRRYRDIWSAILHDDALHALPHHIQIAVAPRVRGCGRAARKAGF